MTAVPVPSTGTDLVVVDPSLPKKPSKKKRPKGLTKVTARDAVPEADRYELRDHKVDGLRLVVQPSGVKTWSVRWSHGNKDQRLTLGTFPHIGLDDARQMAAQTRLKVFQKADPIAERREEKRVGKHGDDMVFKVAYARFLGEHLKLGTKTRTWTEIDRVFNTLILPTFGDRVMTEIPKTEFSSLAAEQKLRGAPAMGNNVHRYIRQFFNWCVGQGIFDRSPSEGLRKPAVQKPRDRWLTDREIRWAWQAADKIGWPYGRMVQMLIVTGARRGEVADMPRSELVAEDRWELPADRSKNGRPLSVFLTPLAQSIIAACPVIKVADDNAASPKAKKAKSMVFQRPSGKRQNYCHGKIKLDKYMLEIAQAESNRPDVTIAPWVLHDLRRTFRSGCARLKLNAVPVNKCMNHATKGIDAVYDQFDYRDEMVDVWSAWAKYVESLIR